MKTMRGKNFRRGERGAALLEFAIGATIFLTATFAVLEVGRLLWVHNSLVDATRRGARYAVNHDISGQSLTEIQNMAVYGNTAGTGQPLVSDLKTTQVLVNYSNYELGAGTVTVTIDKYDFNFVLPLVSTKMRLPTYQTSLTAESAGFVPSTLP